MVRSIFTVIVTVLYVGMYVLDRDGYFDRLSPAEAQAAAYALVLLGGIVIGVTAEYLRQAWVQRRGRASRTEEHAT